MKIAIEGCAHGELNKIYESIEYIQKREKIKVDLLICCGDFQSVRDHDDLLSMAVSAKYRDMKDFSDYYDGKKKAPILTLFIGGNHEAARYLWELPYGGWVAENIYYLGYAGVVSFGGLRIGGISGIFKLRDYGKSHYEKPPFNEDSKRSFYHVRSADVAKLKLLKEVSFDIFLSHDWPRNIYNFGDAEQLMRFKPFLREEIENCSLGSNAAEDLLNVLQPTYWFSGHMHAKFSALVPHDNDTTTKFLALDKCLPKRNFLQIIDISEATEDHTLKYDPYWLCVLKATDTTSFQRSFCLDLPDDLKPTEYDVQKFIEDNSDLNVLNFQKSNPGKNPQTTEFCERFSIADPCVSSKIAGTVVHKQSSTPLRKLNLPTPSKLDLPTPLKNITVKDDFETITPMTLTMSHYKSNDDDDDDDDFGELAKPNISAANPDEIDISESSSDSSNDSSEGSKTTEVNTQETIKNTANTDSPLSVQNPISTPSAKKFKLVRRNQKLYTPDKDDDEY